MSEKDKELYVILGTIIKEARMKNDMTNVEVAKRLATYGIKIADTSLRRYENGERAVNIDVLMGLCEIYNKDYMEVMKEAQLKRLQKIDASYRIFSEKDPNPIAKTYGVDTAEMIKIYSSLNTEGKEQALTQLRMIANTPAFTEDKKGIEELA